MNSETSTELLSDHSEEGSPVISEDECFLEGDDQEDNSADLDDHQSDPDEVEYFSESFNVKGSFWATKYQDALKKALELKSTKENVPVRASFETSNLTDKDAITFEVLCNGVWLVTGYCGVEKIPKLTKAIKWDEITAYKLCFIKRQWKPKIRDFRLYSAVTITKKGRWGKNDNNNQYNSDFAWIFNLKTITNFDSKDFYKQFSLPGPFCNNFCGILHVKGLCCHNIR